MEVAVIMSAREVILSAVRRPAVQMPLPQYAPPSYADLTATFIAKATNSYANVERLAGIDEIPQAVFALLAAAGAETRISLPKESELHTLPWHRAPALQLSGAPPGSEECALSEADHAIAETGTLLFFGGAARPSSWHFLPGREIVIVRRERIVATFEALLASLPMPIRLPSTLNLITGPSRTGDIEQTMERGAHGPRNVDILLAG